MCADPTTDVHRYVPSVTQHSTAPPDLTAFLYRPLQCLGQLPVGHLLGAGVLAPLRAVRQPRAVRQLRLGQEAGRGARGADQQHRLLQVDGTLRAGGGIIIIVFMSAH